MKFSFIIMLYLLTLTPLMADSHMPERGKVMAEVSAEVGEPESKEPAVGEPPITRWNYQNFSVYFEHDTVIHSVKHQKKK